MKGDRWSSMVVSEALQFKERYVVKTIRKIYEVIKPSFAAIARVYHVSAKTIENICKGKTYQCEI